MCYYIEDLRETNTRRTLSKAIQDDVVAIREQTQKLDRRTERLETHVDRELYNYIA